MLLPEVRSSLKQSSGPFWAGKTKFIKTHFGHPTPSVGETLKLPSDLFSTVVCSSKRRSKRRNLWRRRRRRHVGTAESVIPPWARRILFPRPPRPLPGPTEGLQQFGGLTHCDQIGQVWKVLGDNFSYYSSPCVWWLFGLFLNATVLSKNCFGFFLGKFTRIWATLSSHIWSHLWREHTSGGQPYRLETEE